MSSLEEQDQVVPDIHTLIHIRSHWIPLTLVYVAIQDVGSCVGISRLRVYRYICPSRQVGLVLYPETPAPVSGSVNVQFTCVDNAYIPESESDTVTCCHNGTWSTEVPVCEYNVGYENMGTDCGGKSINTV